MSIQREIVGTATVDCPTELGCGGHVTMTVVREYHVLPNGRDVSMVYGENVRQTCGCELTDDQKEDIVARAQQELERPRPEC